MRFIGNIIEKLQRHPKRIVFPEGTEPRVLQAARQFYSLRLGAPILLGDRSKVKENGEALMQPNYFGAMMVAMHQADGFVSGTNQSTGSVLRPLFQIIKVAPQATTASSCQVMEVEDSRFGENGVLLMGDCGVIPDPTVEQLADIAVSTAQLARQLVGIRPRVALLSFSTKGSATHPSIGKVKAATALAQQYAHEQNIQADFDGELQVDAALVPEIAARKLPENKVGGRANVLIFPDLNS